MNGAPAVIDVDFPDAPSSMPLDKAAITTVVDYDVVLNDVGIPDDSRAVDSDNVQMMNAMLPEIDMQKRFAGDECKIEIYKTEVETELDRLAPE